jgi:hypothetical protein
VSILGAVSASGGSGGSCVGGCVEAGGGGGGRIAVLCSGGHSFASDAWADWSLGMSALGGQSGGGRRAGSGTIYVDCGGRSRSLSVIGDADATQTGLAVLLLSSSLTQLDELRLLSGGRLRVMSGLASNATPALAVNVYAGDAAYARHRVTIDDGIAMVLSPTPSASSSPTPFASGQLVRDACQFPVTTWSSARTLSGPISVEGSLVIAAAITTMGTTTITAGCDINITATGSITAIGPTDQRVGVS